MYKTRERERERAREREREKSGREVGELGNQVKTKAPLVGGRVGSTHAQCLLVSSTFHRLNLFFKFEREERDRERESE